MKLRIKDYELYVFEYGLRWNGTICQKTKRQAGQIKAGTAGWQPSALLVSQYRTSSCYVLDVARSGGTSMNLDPCTGEQQPTPASKGQGTPAQPARPQVCRVVEGHEDKQRLHRRHRHRLLVVRHHIAQYEPHRWRGAVNFQPLPGIKGYIAVSYRVKLIENRGTCHQVYVQYLY